jgi:hypothetical protein
LIDDPGSCARASRTVRLARSLISSLNSSAPAPFQPSRGSEPPPHPGRFSRRTGLRRRRRTSSPWGPRRG